MGNNRRFHSGDIIQHFKRETLSETEKKTTKYLYKIIGIATHTESKQILVIYQALYDEFSIFARPYDSFFGKVDKKKYPNIKQEYRLEKVKESNI